MPAWSQSQASSSACFETSLLLLYSTLRPPAGPLALGQFYGLLHVGSSVPLQYNVLSHGIGSRQSDENYKQAIEKRFTIPLEKK